MVDLLHEGRALEGGLGRWITAFALHAALALSQAQKGTFAQDVLDRRAEIGFAMAIIGLRQSYRGGERRHSRRDAEASRGSFRLANRNSSRRRQLGNL